MNAQSSGRGFGIGLASGGPGNARGHLLQFNPLQEFILELDEDGLLPHREPLWQEILERCRMFPL